MKFRDIPKFPRAGYEINVHWYYLERFIETQERPALVLEPDYQRGHVWSEAQQSAYIEYGLMGGESSMVITTNCPGWDTVVSAGPYELVDGLQRVTAVLRFIRGEIRAFGLLCHEYEDRLNLSGPSFRWRVLVLPNRQEVLKFYLLANSGGVVHSPEEIARVRALLEKER